MVKGKTKSGFKYEVPEEALNDMELMDLFVSIEDGEVQNLTKIADKLLGKEQRLALYDHIRVEDGRVPMNSFEEEIGDILANDKLKNSSSSSE